jgi:hypothetical protein
MRLTKFQKDLSMCRISFFAFASVLLNSFASAHEPSPDDNSVRHFNFVHKDHGALAAVNKAVTFASRDDDAALWWPDYRKTDDGHQVMYLHPFASSLFLTAKESGEIVLTEKPEAGSRWAVRFPRGENDEKDTSYLSTLKSRRLDVVKKIVDGKETTGIELKLGPEVKGNFDKEYPLFHVIRGGYHAVPEIKP